MHPLEQKTHKFITEHSLISYGETIIIGVSGGPDSMSLMHILHELKAHLHSTLMAAYVDHCLRPQETPAEIKLVEEQANIRNIQFFLHRADVQSYASSRQLSIEHAGRLLRYDFFQALAKKHHASKIAVGHTADDQAEEILLRLLRGAGSKGLAGMSPLRQGEIIRPLLETRKTELLDYINEKNIPFAEDSTNKERYYLRNRIRMDLLPNLEENYNPSIRKTLLQTAAILREENDLLDDLTEKTAKKILLVENMADDPTLASHKIHIDSNEFSQVSVAIQRRLLEKAIILMSGQPHFNHIEQIRSLVEGKNKKELHLPLGLRAIISENKLLFTYPVGKGTHRGKLNGNETPFSYIITEPSLLLIEETGQTITIALLNKVPSIEEIKLLKGELFDAEVLTFPIIIRSTTPGDRFRPLGGKGSKKIGDFFTDLKVPQNIRKTVPLVESNGDIAAVLGFRIDDRYRITEKTRKALLIRVDGKE